ncbi:O-linked N-acetylglucosamine transferase, SPINDLY family protein [Allorhizobium taibaishanense]|uniref:protein O-GlcNAc transferase n=1 Tax=Allorhizobium taibaishanense TaxID=887144 RepID=A0A1Q9AAL2_9HYPH|nr:glycosyltransferase family 41 protein [Allorhizobium taibaishanense]MBB4007084.1 putative O-linked N-acetylglucosamine transferase (SPINDLY family) [Allorhizobium taibaishanense]OLP51878.1 hypothetical protein BJF91_23450 [Allorhizobium taibaishanense]
MTILYRQALEQFREGAYDAALSTASRLLQDGGENADALILAASVHERLGSRLEAADLFERAIALDPVRRRELGFRACSHYLEGGRADLALRALLALYPHCPDDVEINHSICSLYRDAGRYPDAVPYAEKLLTLGRDFDHWLNAGMIMVGTGHPDKALPVLKAAHAARPDERLALTELFWCATALCDFDLSRELQAKLEAAYEADGMQLDIRENVFRSLHWSGDEAYHVLSALKTAEQHMGRVVPRQAYRRQPGRRLRVGYVSSDFYQQATLVLLTGMLEHHDRDRFEVFGICHTAAVNRKGPLRHRFLEAIEHYVDILDLTDDQAAAAIRRLDLDILVDLKGFTFDNRLGIFCRRPAPVQVSYLGFPGSVAGVGIDYAIADAFVAPPSSEQFYAERIIRLPNSYQCNDNNRERVAREGSRSRYGLPEEGVVFSSFNQAVKIRDQVFTTWMQILKSVDRSVLWLLDMPPVARNNLRDAAARLGVEPDRLIFAPRIVVADHLRRLAHVDIALDTSPCNGHTTTADALWAAVPVLTWKGSSFASRVSESLLNAVGLQELVADGLDEFGCLAVELAQDEVRQSHLRQHLIRARDTAPLFDTPRFTRDFETALEAICSDAERA